MKKPVEEECLIPTLNKMGWMTTTLDPFSQAFVDYAAQIKDPALDIAAAYGVATLAALQKGATMIANDIDERHLHLLEKDVRPADRSRLTLMPGKFPEDLSIKENSLGAALICRLLHFFNGEQIQTALETVKSWLKPQGKIFIVCDTIYLAWLKGTVEEFEQRIKNQQLWPGIFVNIEKYAKENYTHNLPTMFHLFTVETLAKTVEDAGFSIEKCDYINQKDRYPNSSCATGKESVGIIATKL